MGPQTATTIVIYVIVIALVLRRTLTTQTMRVASLPVLAVVYAAVAIYLVAIGSPRSLLTSPVLWIALAIGVALGAVLGYLRGRHSVVTPGPRPGTVRVKAAPFLAAVLVIAVLMRLGIRSLMPGHSDLGIAISDGLIMFAALSVIIGRLLLFFAARRLIARAIKGRDKIRDAARGVYACVSGRGWLCVVRFGASGAPAHLVQRCV